MNLGEMQTFHPLDNRTNTDIFLLTRAHTLHQGSLFFVVHPMGLVKCIRTCGHDHDHSTVQNGCTARGSPVPPGRPTLRYLVFCWK